MQTNEQPVPQRNLNIKTRKSRRSSVRMIASVRYLTTTVTGRIVDVSPTGIALDLAKPLQAGPGSKVRVECDDIGGLDGTVRWSHNGRIGIEFDPSSNASAKVASYFRFFHKEVKPVLRR